MFAIACLLMVNLMVLSVTLLMLVVIYSRRVEKNRTALIQQRDSLWMLLDNIDTLDDICRDDNVRFRNAVRTIQKKRHDVLNGDQVSDEISRRSEHSCEVLIGTT